MAVGSKYNTLTTANNIGQLRTDHNLIVNEVNLFSNTTGINHGTLSILSVKGTANVSANATFSGQNTSVTGTFTVGGSRMATNTQLQSALSNTNLAIANRIQVANATLLINDRIQVANADTRFFQTGTTSETVTSNTTFSGSNTNITGGTLLVTSNTNIFGETNFQSNGSVKIPRGTTGERSASGENGSIRFNTTLNTVEGYLGGTWIDLATSPSSGATIYTTLNFGGF